MLCCIRVNAVAPGPVDTPQFRKECGENPEQLWLDAQGTYEFATCNPLLQELNLEQYGATETSANQRCSEEHCLPRERSVEQPCPWAVDQRRLGEDGKGHVDEGRMQLDSQIPPRGVRYGKD